MSVFETLLSSDLLLFLLADLIIALAFLFAMRFFTGTVDNIDTIDELAKRDNFAFGISLAGAIFGLGIVLSGAISGEKAATLPIEILGMSLYGLAGLVLIKLGRWIHDRVSLNRLDKNAEIARRNVAVAIVDACAAISTAIIIRSTLVWAEGLELITFIAIFCGFLIYQTIMLLMTRYREHRYSRGNLGTSMQQAFKDNNIAAALRHGGYLIGVAIAVTIASNYIYYDTANLLTTLGSWMLFSLVMLTTFTLLAIIAKKIILNGVNINKEVDLQNNIGIAAMDMAINLSIAVILMALLI
ncbi:DUF350 domain-containing protein [Moritella sp.]|uniref:DUF350 domain-containing protein n=1 Tax=Moritella sp. TaxID=78556 RepID=UPI001DDF812E|nr:DUF350 domain-containing protein [Moritella sp.]MCJ8349631.1 DUF350 domain-containing protein [Moritella sp.]NQZ41172.1 DUF350 domain-containing protein [Moritella sp.]